MNKLRAVAMLRVSDDDQVDGFSLPAQSRAFFKFCEDNDLEVANIYREEGVSAWVDSVDKRPVLKQALKDASEGKYDVAVAHTHDRVSRNAKVLTEVMSIFDAHGVTFRCICTASTILAGCVNRFCRFDSFSDC